MSGPTPTITVIMPVHNAESSVARAARSILDGTLADIELCVIDDHCTDSSVASVFAIDDERIRVIASQRRGIVGALNTGIENARGRLIARMDADDLSHPERLACQLAKLDRDGLDIVGSMVRVVDPDGNLVPTMQRYERWINDHLTHDDIAALRFVESPFVHPTVLARREVFEGGYRDGDFPEDYDLWLRAIASGCRVGKVNRVLLDWTERPDRLTRTCDRYLPEAFDRCRRRHLMSGPLNGAEIVDLWGAGKTGKPWLRWLQSQGVAVRTVFEIDPRKVGELIHGVPVVHPDEMKDRDGPPLVIAVGAEGARELIIDHILERGYVLGKHAWFVA